ncbi:MAG: hypothetical protein AB7E37_04060 [Candidatus Altimarinota bacterium]
MGKFFLSIIIVLFHLSFKYHSGTCQQNTQLAVLLSIPLLTFFDKSKMYGFAIQVSTLIKSQASIGLYSLSLVMILSIFQVWSIYGIVQVSIGFLDNLSSFQAIIQVAFHSYIGLTILLNSSLQGAFALLLSIKVHTMFIHNDFAFNVITFIWSSSDCTCLSSVSVDFLAYRKYFILFFIFFKLLVN